MDGKGVPPECGNFKIVDMGPDDEDCQPLTHDENMALVRTLLGWLAAVLGIVTLVSFAVGYSTERFAGVLLSSLAVVS